MLLIDAIFIGLLEASPLILAAMGFTLIYYLNGFMNIAYAESITFGLSNAEALVGKNIAVRLLEWSGNENNDFFANESEYQQIAQNNYVVQGDEGSNLITVPVSFDSDPIQLQDNRYYIALIRYLEPPNSEPMFLQASDAYDFNPTFFAYEALESPRYFGMLRTNFNSDDISFAGFGLNVVPVVRLNIFDPTIGVEAPAEQTANPWRLYPNPATDRVYLTTVLPHFNVPYQLYAPDGKMLRSGSISRLPHEVSLRGLAAGSYQLRVGDYWLSVRKVGE